MSFDKLFDGSDAHLPQEQPGRTVFGTRTTFVDGELKNETIYIDEVYMPIESTHAPDVSIKAPETYASDLTAFNRYCESVGGQPTKTSFLMFQAGWNARAQAGQVERQAVPDGWKLVPIVPTEEMITAKPKSPGAQGQSCQSMQRNADIAKYSAMIAAAPTGSAK